VSRKRFQRCWVLAFALALILGLAFLPLAKRPVDRALAAEARTALSADDVTGVTATSDWARITLTGPAAAESAALAAAAGIQHRSAVDDVRYVVAGGPGDVPVPDPLNQVRVEAEVDAAADPKVVLTGQVADDAQRSALVQAAVEGVGTDGVDDRLTVTGEPAKDGVEAAVTALAGLLTPLSAGVSTGSASLTDTRLTVSGVGKDAAQVDAVEAALAAARAAGATVDGSVTAPDGADPGDGAGAVGQRLAAVPGIRSIRFATGSSRIATPSRQTLDRVAAVLDAAPEARIVVAGYTDDRGSASGNLALSRQRADAVRAYLVSAGVAAENLRPVGYGAARPVASNATSAGRKANRRIEFTVQES
jgi:OmpA-OmpF porin, OOP family